LAQGAAEIRCSDWGGIGKHVHGEHFIDQLSRIPGLSGLTYVRL